VRIPSTSRPTEAPNQTSHFDRLLWQFPHLSGPACLLPQLNTGSLALHGRATAMRGAFCDQGDCIRTGDGGPRLGSGVGRGPMLDRP
jgi:hypothetical protein